MEYYLETAKRQKTIPIEQVNLIWRNAYEGKKQRLIRLFIFLFSVSVSVTVLPCGIINTHDLFGQLISSTITEDDDKSCFEERSVYENRK